MSLVQHRAHAVRADVSEPLAGIGLAAAGLAVWTLFSAFSGRRELDGFRLGEAWDGMSYFAIGLPFMAACVAFAAYRSPRRPLRWPLWMVAGHQLGVMFGGLGLQSGLSRLILTIALAMLLAVMFAGPALFGSMLARNAVGRG